MKPKMVQITFVPKLLPQYVRLAMGWPLLRPLQVWARVA